MRGLWLGRPSSVLLALLALALAVSNVHDPGLTQVAFDGVAIYSLFRYIYDVNPGSQQNAGVKTPVVLQLSLVQIEHVVGPDTV
eukprot:COSAG01_NODE_20353_length_958_cov_1.383003_2_plen_84_part_00